MTTEQKRLPKSGEQVHVFTSAALNYLPKVRTLFSSLRRHHPEWKLHLLLADELSNAAPAQESEPSRPEARHLDLSQEPFDAVVTLQDLAIPDWQGWSFCHTITELATAIKPFMLRCLLAAAEEGDKVLYLDPDIAVFSRLDDISAALDKASIVLTPHQVQEEGGLAAIIDNEICSLKHGIYNLGFIGVRKSSEGDRFAAWWSKRCYFFCRDDIANSLFTDQRWIDLVPALFSEVSILRNSRFNLATWNITTRELSQTDQGEFRVDGQPLGFYHFTGFDSGAHRIMAAKNGKNNPVLEQVICWYEKQLSLHNQGSSTLPAWAYATFSNGEPILKEQRILYRFRVDLQKAFPNPYDADGYQKWWQHRGAQDFEDYSLRRSQPNFYLTPGFLGSEGGDYAPPRLVDVLRRIRQQPRSAGPTVRHGWYQVRDQLLQRWLAKLRRKLRPSP